MKIQISLNNAKRSILVNKQTALRFVIGTYCLTILMWGGIILANQFGYLAYGTPFFMIFYIIGGSSPPIVAITYIVKDKVMPVKQLFKTIFAINQPVRMYLYAISLAALYYIIPALFGKIEIVSPLYVSLLSLPLMVFGGGLEEVGWRFILQPTFEKKFSFIIATTFTAIIWSVWHLPLFFIQGTYQYTQNFGLFMINAFGLSFALASIYRISNSIWLCIFFHTIINSVLESIHVENNIISSTVSTVILIIISTAFIFIKGKYHKKNHCLQ